jgi:hypothetical protein
MLFLAVPSRQAAAQAPASRSIVVKSATKERHPRIRAAIKELEAAKVELQKAPHDFGGHRADAVQAVDRAVEQLRLALQYDKK